MRNRFDMARGTAWRQPVVAALAFALLAPAGCATPAAAPPATAATTPPADAPVAAINLAHFDHLFAETTMGGERVGVLNIYSEAPDYRFAIEPNEGYACVDDVARGMVLLAATRDLGPARMRQLELMTRFVVRMAADNGYFHNFIWADGRINREYRTSLAELNWWSLRALWGLEAALTRLPADGETATRARRAADRLVANLIRDLPPSPTTQRVEGIAVPTVLPFGSGADAGAAAVLALVAHVRRTGDPAARMLVARLSEGLAAAQAGDADDFPHYAHLSWRNRWHAWGNAQAWALLRAGELLGRADLTASALREIDHFYPHLLQRGMLSDFTLHRQGGALAATEVERHPQIAYGLSPMVIAATEAYRITGRPQYRQVARALGAWFAGANSANTAMYDPASGRVFDGIVAPGTVNRNSGAESTIEGLFALHALNGTTLP